MHAFVIMKRAQLLLLAAAACITPAQAQLPSLEDNIWLGYFAGHTSKDFLFGVGSNGEIRLQLTSPKSKGGSGSGIAASAMIILVGVEEDKPGAKPAIRTLKEETLETKDKPTAKLQKTVIRGSVTGDATIELTVERVSGKIVISNRLIDPGTLTKNPIRPVVVLQMKSLYSSAEGEPSKAQLKAREADQLELKWTDGTRKKISLTQEMDATLEAVNGPGIAIAELEAGGIIRDRKLMLEATEGVSVLRVGNQTPQMLNRGMRFTAMPAPAKPGGNKPNDTARLTLSVR
jgi:hypothetical protein